MNEEPKGFTVKDRRHFTAGGEVRPEPGEARPGSAGEAPAREPSTAAGPDHGEPASAAGGTEAREVDFSSFLVSLAAQAGAALHGGEEHGPDLPGARQIIGILEMLRDKTEGRRSPDEDRVLDGLLYQLRMAFVQRSRS